MNLRYSPIKNYQSKLSISAADDPLEHQADAMVDRVMRMPEKPFIQRRCFQSEKDELQRKRLKASITPFLQVKASEGGLASESISNQINLPKGNGNSMDSGTRTFMENRFCNDFSDSEANIRGPSIFQ